MKRLPQPLTNVQLEILKAFSFNLDNNELQDFKDSIAQYFANRAIQAANRQWDNNNWDDKKVEELLHAKMRKSKKLL